MPPLHAHACTHANVASSQRCRLHVPWIICVGQNTAFWAAKTASSASGSGGVGVFSLVHVLAVPPASPAVCFNTQQPSTCLHRRFPIAHWQAQLSFADSNLLTSPAPSPSRVTIPRGRARRYHPIPAPLDATYALRVPSASRAAPALPHAIRSKALLPGTLECRASSLPTLLWHRLGPVAPPCCSSQPRPHRRNVTVCLSSSSSAVRGAQGCEAATGCNSTQLSL